MRVGIDADLVDLLRRLLAVTDRHFEQRGRLAIEIGLLSAGLAWYLRKNCKAASASLTASSRGTFR